ncbi:MAG TPA: hypothetical protein VJQ50_19560 [Terriglobales bacterium]|jgi:hypothetical protein|nr:hypothetical protein [Terriglobales bacterium]
MSELENRLNRILEEHQHESGLHMIGGRHKLLDRLVRFCEQELKPESLEERPAQENHFGRTA